MPGYAEYVPTTDYSKCKNGSYPATIVSAKVVKENGQPKYLVSDNGSKKLQIDVRFQLDATNDEGDPIELSRRFGLTYGKNRSTGVYSAWSQLVEVATGVKGGDAAQHHIGDEELSGKRLVVRVKNVESNGNKYSNVVDFEEIDEVPAPVAAANRTRLEAVVKTPDARLGLAEGDLKDLNLDEIPF